MIIDCHGDYTTAPKELDAWRQQQIAGLKMRRYAAAKDRGKIFYRKVSKVYPRFKAGVTG